MVVYEPHQNTRQAGLVQEYADAFAGVERLYWLPTYLTREDESIKELKPGDFIDVLENKKIAEPAELGEELGEKLLGWHEKGYLVLLMTAGPADLWLRKLVYAGNQESAATRFIHSSRNASDESDAR